MLVGLTPAVFFLWPREVMAVVVRTAHGKIEAESGRRQATRAERVLPPLRPAACIRRSWSAGWCELKYGVPGSSAEAR